MGSMNCKLEDDKQQEKFVGREHEIRTIKKLLKNKRDIGVFGMEGIGKSRFIRQVIRDIPNDRDDSVFYKDFEIDDAYDVVTQYSWLEEFYRQFGHEHDLKRLSNSFPAGKIQCAEGEKCAGLSCEALKNEMNIAVNCLKRRQKETYILLDNIDDLIANKGIKDVLLKFISLSSTHCRSVKIMVTSANTISKIASFGSITLDKIDDEAALDILYDCVVNKPSFVENELECGEQNTEKDTEQKSKDRRFNRNKVFTSGNERLIREVVTLCEGLPKAVLAIGQFLTEDNFLFTPKDAFQLLILSRLQVLSPENAPPSDRLDQYKETISKLNTAFYNFYESCIERMDGNICPIEDAIVGKPESSARMKQLVIKPLIDKSLMYHKDEKLFVHGVLKECVVMLKHTNNSTDAEETKGWLIKCIKENAKRSSLEIPEECFEDSRKLEEFINNLPSQIFAPRTHRQIDEKGDHCTGGDDLTSVSQQRTYSSEDGPRAMSYKDMSLEQTIKQIEVETETVDGSSRESEGISVCPVKQNDSQCEPTMAEIDINSQPQHNTVEQGVVSVERRHDQIEENGERLYLAPYKSDSGSIVCQPEPD